MYMLDVSVQLRIGEAIQNYVELFISEVWQSKITERKL